MDKIRVSTVSYIAALFVPSIGTTDIMIKGQALTNFTKQALLDRTKAIQALNEEQIQMSKAVIHNRMALDILTAAQGGTCAIIKAECCVYIFLIYLTIYLATLDDMKGQVKAMSADNLPFWACALAGEGCLVENYISHCYSCSVDSVMSTLCSPMCC